jgi:S-adenosyl methyltransferase
MMTEFGFQTPTAARVWDCLTGGKDNFEPDRAVSRLIDEICPELAKHAADNREFVARAVTYAAAQGVGQFIDLGAGLPRSPMPHETAREVVPGARVAYVDHDPQVLAHLTAWYGHNDPGVTVVGADAADHRKVLAAVRGPFDLSRPCCVILGMMPHYFEAAAARALIGGYLDAAAPGSYLIASSAYSTCERAGELWAEYSEAVCPAYRHSPEVFASFFAGAELILPGVSEISTWRAEWPAPGPLDATQVILCAVARKR